MLAFATKRTVENIFIVSTHNFFLTNQSNDFITNEFNPNIDEFKMKLIFTIIILIR